MRMKNLIPLLVFLAFAALVGGNIAFFFFLVSVIIVATVLRKVAGRASRDGSETTPAWKQKLVQAFAEIRKEMEARTTVSPKEDSVWQELMGETPEAEEFEDLDLGPPPEPKTAPRRSRIETVGEPPAERADSRREPPKVSEPAVPTRPRRRRRRFSVRRTSLQEAVVWSEILAPPLALREEQEPRW
jgi:hypothetical protein